MALPPAGTFLYTAVVPPHDDRGVFECPVTCPDPIVPGEDDFENARLVGRRPLLQISDAGLTPDAGPQRPWVLRSRIGLIATSRELATVAEASWHVDKALTACLQPGDELYLARTMAGGVGLSIVRRGELIAATGAITAVPLGRRVRASWPTDLIARAAAIFQERDPEFDFAEVPLEIVVDGSRTILYRGRPRIRDYHVYVERGGLDGLPGTCECAAIWHEGQCASGAAPASALLMAAEGALSLTRWPD